VRTSVGDVWCSSASAREAELRPGRSVEAGGRGLVQHGIKWPKAVKITALGVLLGFWDHRTDLSDGVHGVAPHPW